MSTARATLDTVRFFCDAGGRAADDVEAFRRYLQAAIVFARSVTFHLKKEYSDSAGFRDSWWPEKQQALDRDEVAKFFLKTRNFILKERPIPLVIAAEFEADAFATGWVELEVLRSAPWYRRSPKTIWEDTKRAALRPLQKWRHRLTTQRRRRRAQKRTARRTTTTIQDYYFSDRKWSETPAVALLSAYLDTLSTVVGLPRRVGEGSLRGPDRFSAIDVSGGGRDGQPGARPA